MILIATTTDVLPAAAGGMNPWIRASLICLAGAVGGAVNALITANGFVLPTLRRSIWCPGFLANLLVGAFAAFASWSFYGSGAGVELAAKTAPERGVNQPEIFCVGRRFFSRRRWSEMDYERGRQEVAQRECKGRWSDGEIDRRGMPATCRRSRADILIRVERASQAVKAA